MRKSIPVCAILILTALSAGCQTNGTKHPSEKAQATGQAVYDEPQWWLNRALESAQKIEDQGYRDSALGAIVEVQARGGMFEQAIATADMIGDPSYKVGPLAVLAQSRVKRDGVQNAAGAFDEAVAVARKISEHQYEAAALLKVARFARGVSANDVSARVLKEALSALSDVAPPETRAWQMTDIAGEQALAGDGESAAKTLAETITVAKTIENIQQRTYAIRSVAVAQFKAGLQKESRETFKQAIDCAAQLEHGQEAVELRVIAEEQAKLGIYEDALKTVGMIKNPEFVDCARWAICVVQAENGKINDALATLKNIESPKWKACAWAAVGEADAATGTEDVAVYDFQQAANETKNCSKYDQDFVISTIAQAQARAGMIRAAYQSADLIVEDEYRSRALAAIVEKEIAEGKLEAALDTAKKAGNSDLVAMVAIAQAKQRLFDDAVKNAKDIRNKWDSAKALAAIAVEEVNAGRGADALALVKGINDTNTRSYALRVFAAASGRYGDNELLAKGLEPLRAEAPMCQAWYCIGAARGLIEKQHPNETIKWTP